MESYTIHITLNDVALFGLIFIGLTFILLLWFTKRASRFLAATLAIATLWMARILATDLHLADYNTFWNYLPPRFSLALGPFIFFYVLSLTRPENRFHRKDLLHFSPVLLELLVQIPYSLKTGTTTYDAPLVQQLSPALNIFAFVSVNIYLYRCRALIAEFNKEVKFNGGDRYRHKLRWLHNLLTAFWLVWLLWVPFAVMDHFYHAYPLRAIAFHLLSMLLMSILVWVAARAFLRADVDWAADIKPILKALPPAELREKGLWLKKVIKENLYYEDSELSLSSLADKLGLHTHELSRIINTGLKKSFNDFVNEYRIKAAARKMQDPANDHLTLLGIAFESGFNSQSSFNRIFKQMTGKSPVEYKNSLKKEYPSYNLISQSQFAPVVLSRESSLTGAHDKLNRKFMLKNYFKIAWRNLMRNKGYTTINVTGLAVGIAVCIMIFIIVQYQTSFDNFHPRKDRTYRVLTEQHHADAATISYTKSVPFQIPAELKAAFPQLEQVVPVYASHNDELQVVGSDGAPVKNFKEQSGVFYTSPSFFDIFHFPLLTGSYASLKDPNNVLLTKEIADTYFGDWKKAMGKTIKITGYYSIGAGLFQFPAAALKVSGILATIPANTDFQLKLVVAYGTDFTGDSQYGFQKPDLTETAPDFGCYVLLPQNYSAGNFNQQLNTYAKRTQSADRKDSYIIQPLDDVHYDAEAGNYSNKTFSRTLLNVLWLIAAFILLIACVNFINLSTAQAVNRAKEVGVRKVLGSSRSQLQVQFIVETFLIVTGAVLFAAVISMLALPYVNRLLELSISFNTLSSPTIILFLLSVTVVVTALAGFYPSIVLSNFNPVNALKSRIIVNATNGLSLRRGLVVFQFIIAQALIIGTLVIVKQMDYFMDQPLGFDKDAIVNVPYRPDSTGSKQSGYLRQQLLQVNGVKAVSFSSNSPVEDDHNMFTTLKFNNSIKDADFQAITKFADEEYVPTYKLQVVAGRNLQPSGWTREFLVNESFVKSLGLKRPEDILNKEVSIMNGLIKCPVVGVLKDFNNRSLRNKLAPLLIATNSTMYRQASIKLATTNIASAMQSVKKVWKQTFPDYVYEYKFLDDKIASFYKQEDQLSALYKIFSAIAIFLSCLGLYGLASFMAAQRIKEVGIRKVLGATAGNIVYLFSKEFMILIAIAFAIAAPIAWYYMHQWLQAYAYRINISWWIPVAGGFVAIIIALVTISFQALKAAMANPVKSLRSE